MTIRIPDDGKLESLNWFPIDRNCRKQVSKVLNPLKLKPFRSVNSSIGLMGANASLLCTFYSSLLQHRVLNPTVQDFIYQINVLNFVKKHGTSVRYNGPKKATIICLLLLLLMPVNKMITVSCRIWQVFFLVTLNLNLSFTQCLRVHTNHGILSSPSLQLKL